MRQAETRLVASTRSQLPSRKQTPAEAPTHNQASKDSPSRKQTPAEASKPRQADRNSPPRIDTESDDALDIALGMKKQQPNLYEDDDFFKNFLPKSDSPKQPVPQRPTADQEAAKKTSSPKRGGTQNQNFPDEVSKRHHSEPSDRSDELGDSLRAVPAITVEHLNQEGEQVSKKKYEVSTPKRNPREESHLDKEEEEDLRFIQPGSDSRFAINNDEEYRSQEQGPVWHKMSDDEKISRDSSEPPKPSNTTNNRTPKGQPSIKVTSPKHIEGLTSENIDEKESAWKRRIEDTELKINKLPKKPATVSPSPGVATNTQDEARLPADSDEEDFDLREHLTRIPPNNITKAKISAASAHAAVPGKKTTDLDRIPTEESDRTSRGPTSARISPRGKTSPSLQEAKKLEPKASIDRDSSGRKPKPENDDHDFFSNNKQPLPIPPSKRGKPSTEVEHKKSVGPAQDKNKPRGVEPRTETELKKSIKPAQDRSKSREPIHQADLKKSVGPAIDKGKSRLHEPITEAEDKKSIGPARDRSNAREPRPDIEDKRSVGPARDRSNARETKPDVETKKSLGPARDRSSAREPKPDAETKKSVGPGRDKSKNREPSSDTDMKQPQGPALDKGKAPSSELEAKKSIGPARDMSNARELKPDIENKKSIGPARDRSNPREPKPDIENKRSVGPGRDKSKNREPSSDIENKKSVGPARDNNNNREPSSDTDMKKPQGPAIDKGKAPPSDLEAKKSIGPARDRSSAREPKPDAETKKSVGPGRDKSKNREPSSDTDMKIPQGPAVDKGKSKGATTKPEPSRFVGPTGDKDKSRDLTPEGHPRKSIPPVGDEDRDKSRDQNPESIARKPAGSTLEKDKPSTQKHVPDEDMKKSTTPSQDKTKTKGHEPDLHQSIKPDHDQKKVGGGISFDKQVGRFENFVPVKGVDKKASSRSINIPEKTNKSPDHATKTSDKVNVKEPLKTSENKHGRVEPELTDKAKEKAEQGALAQPGKNIGIDHAEEDEDQQDKHRGKASKVHTNTHLNSKKKTPDLLDDSEGELMRKLGIAGSEEAEDEDYITGNLSQADGSRSRSNLGAQDNHGIEAELSERLNDSTGSKHSAKGGRGRATKTQQSKHINQRPIGPAARDRHATEAELSERHDDSFNSKPSAAKARGSATKTQQLKRLNQKQVGDKAQDRHVTGPGTSERHDDSFTSKPSNKGGRGAATKTQQLKHLNQKQVGDKAQDRHVTGPGTSERHDDSFTSKPSNKGGRGAATKTQQSKSNNQKKKDDQGEGMAHGTGAVWETKDSDRQEVKSSARSRPSKISIAPEDNTKLSRNMTGKDLLVSQPKGPVLKKVGTEGMIETEHGGDSDQGYFKSSIGQKKSIGPKESMKQQDEQLKDFHIDHPGPHPDRFDNLKSPNFNTLTSAPPRRISPMNPEGLVHGLNDYHPTGEGSLDNDDSSDDDFDLRDEVKRPKRKPAPVAPGAGDWPNYKSDSPKGGPGNPGDFPSSRSGARYSQPPGSRKVGSGSLPPNDDYNTNVGFPSDKKPRSTLTGIMGTQKEKYQFTEPMIQGMPNSKLPADSRSGLG